MDITAMCAMYTHTYVLYDDRYKNIIKLLIFRKNQHHTPLETSLLKLNKFQRILINITPSSMLVNSIQQWNAFYESSCNVFVV